MYNPVINPSLLEANYTTLFRDIILNNTSVMTLLTNRFNRDYEQIININADGYHSLLDEIEEKYKYYEINTENPLDWLSCMFDVFEEHVHYFIQLAQNYYKEYDYAVGNRKRVSRTDVSSRSRDASLAEGSNVENEILSSDTNKSYDLPHKEVSDTEAKGYMTDRKDNDSNSKSNENRSRESESNEKEDNNFTSSVETIYDNEFLDLKRKYLQQIRNINDEFASKFEDCFLHIFS